MIEIPDLKDYPPRPGEHPRRRWWKYNGDDACWERSDGVGMAGPLRGDPAEWEAVAGGIDRESPLPMPPLRAGQVWMDLRTGRVQAVVRGGPADPPLFFALEDTGGATVRVPGDPGIVLLYDPFGGPWAPAEP